MPNQSTITKGYWHNKRKLALWNIRSAMGAQYLNIALYSSETWKAFLCRHYWQADAWSRQEYDRLFPNGPIC